MAGDGTIASRPPSTRPRLYGIVETYMRKRLSGDVHPAFEVLRQRREAVALPPPIPLAEESEAQQGPEIETADVPDDDEVPLEELYKDAESEKKLFRAVIETYEQTTQNSKYKTGILADSVHTWEEVLAKIDLASETYNDVPGFWGKIRKSLRSFGKSNEVFGAWLELLPSQSEYFSILCGGLKLIFGAAARLKDLRDDICEALAEIPVLLSSTHRALGAFRKSKTLHQCSANLYIATLEALNHIVTWYKEKAMKKLFKSLFKQSTYEHLLSEKLQTIRTQSKRFEDSAILCSYETIAHTDQALTSHRKELRETGQRIIGELDRSRYESFQQHRYMNDSLSRKAEDMQTIMGGMSNRIKTLEETLAKFLSSNARIDYKTEDVRELMPPLRKVASESQLREERPKVESGILAALDYDHAVLKRDVTAKLRIIWTLPRPEQDRVVAIMRTPKLHRWITTTSSSAIFINGNYQGPRWQQPTSFICAKLIDSVQPPSKVANMVPLAFFCGEHLEPEDPDFALDGMMRSLLAQLLLAFPTFNLQTIRQMQYIDYDDLNDLCDIFEILIMQLPPRLVVFCTIDAITLYEEKAAMREEARSVLDALVDLTERTGEGGCAFKLLVMSPWNSSVIYKSMRDQQEDVLWMPSKVPSLGGFTAAGWKSTIESHLAVG